jgi:hypothetical protein
LVVKTMLLWCMVHYHQMSHCNFLNQQCCFDPLIGNKSGVWVCSSDARTSSLPNHNHYVLEYQAENFEVFQFFIGLKYLFRNSLKIYINFEWQIYIYQGNEYKYYTHSNISLIEIFFTPF